MGEGAESARAEVLAARAEVGAALGRLDAEIVRLEASTRAALDVKAKVRRSPGKVAAVLAGTGFVLVGGPGRMFRRARNAVLGAPAPLPESMLPAEIDAALRALGDDGGRVRGAIERDFAKYLEDRAPELRSHQLFGSLARLVTMFGRPIAFRYGIKVANSLLGTDNAQYADQLAKAQVKRPAARRPKLPI